MRLYNDCNLQGIPQIGYGATTTDLSDKEQFGYFLRTVPSDLWQARAIMELLRHYNWTYIAVVYSAGVQMLGRPCRIIGNRLL